MITRASVIAVFVSLACFGVPALADDACDGSPLPCPVFVLKDKLQGIFAISHCQFISGLTCKVTYNGKAPLPSEVFFTEFDAEGHRAGKRVRLIYPHLNPGERGAATFRLRSSNPATIELTGVWDGPWKDPY